MSEMNTYGSSECFTASAGCYLQLNVFGTGSVAVIPWIEFVT